MRTPSYRHQIAGVEELVQEVNPERGRVLPRCLLLADVVGLGKTKQVIDAAQTLHERGQIDTVIVLAPVAARSLVWFDPDTGEIAKHLWPEIQHYVLEYHNSPRFWRHSTAEPSVKQLRWTMTNYEYLRDTSRIADLPTGDRTILVCDEAWMVAGWKSQQTRAAAELRRRCGWVWELNGTPVGQSPADLYAQMAILDPRILGCKNWYHFRARYAVMGGFKNKQIVAWVGLEDLQQRIAPYVLRREKFDGDAPPKLEPVVVPVALTTETWRHYRDMKSEMISWLKDEKKVATASQAGVRAIRLAQICGGQVGGVYDHEEWVEQGQTEATVEDIGREKLDALLDLIGSTLEQDPQMKMLIWCRFRAEAARVAEAIPIRFPDVWAGRIVGGQHRDERAEAAKRLDHSVATEQPVAIVGNVRAGGAALNLTAADHCVYFSNDPSVRARLQSEGRPRPDRPGRTRPVAYYDLVATGPNGQRTMDWITLRALQQREEMATWTTSAWITVLEEE